MSAPAAGAAETHLLFKLTSEGGDPLAPAAAAGFEAAAAYWSSVLTTSQPVTVNLSVGYRPLAAGVLSETTSYLTQATVDDVAGRIAARQFSPLDAQAVAGLPALKSGILGPASAVDVLVPGPTILATGAGIDNSVHVLDNDGGFNNSFLGLTTANAKALGYEFEPGALDGSIVFSSALPFDLRPGDGVAAGHYDFVGVAIHEIGHALGFLSRVDDYDVLGVGGARAGDDCGGVLCQDLAFQSTWGGETLDLFRYSAPGILDWTAGDASYLSFDHGLTAFAGGYFSTGAFNGDGHQASHWKDHGDCVDALGIMNPTYCTGLNGFVTGLDLAALDAIGWNVDAKLGDYGGYQFSSAALGGGVPEPAAWTLSILGLGLAGSQLRRRRLAEASRAAP